MFYPNCTKKFICTGCRHEKKRFKTQLPAASIKIQLNAFRFSACVHGDIDFERLFQNMTSGSQHVQAKNLALHLIISNLFDLPLVKDWFMRLQLPCLILPIVVLLHDGTFGSRCESGKFMLGSWGSTFTSMVTSLWQQIKIIVISWLYKTFFCNPQTHQLIKSTRSPDGRKTRAFATSLP